MSEEKKKAAKTAFDIGYGDSAEGLAPESPFIPGTNEHESYHRGFQAEQKEAMSAGTIDNSLPADSDDQLFDPSQKVSNPKRVK